jgi:hypothetical protein
MYVRAHGSSATTGSPDSVANDASVLVEPPVVFRSIALGAHYGQLAAVPLADPAGARANLGMNCERTYATRTTGVCLFAKRGVVQTYGIPMLDGQLRPTGQAELAGLASRVRISADSSLVATTTFVGGHSYAQAAFSTETIIRGDGKSLATSSPGGAPSTAGPCDRLIGISGASHSPTKRHLLCNCRQRQHGLAVPGSIKGKSMISLRTDAECPSLSPDQTKIAYKRRIDSKTRGVWRLALLDLRTRQESLLVETRSVDDQVEWLNDNRLFYGLFRPGLEAATSYVWVVSANGTGSPTVFIPEASSPAVVP